MRRWQLSFRDVAVFTAFLCLSFSLLIASAQLMHNYTESRIGPAVLLQLLGVFTFGNGCGFVAEKLLCGDKARMGRGPLIGGVASIILACGFIGFLA